MFASHFGALPQAVASAPGRVNLMGEHTDYNDGYVLPVPLGLEVAVAISRRGDAGKMDIISEDFENALQLKTDAAASGSWGDFMLGALNQSDGGDADDSGYQIAIASSLPMGAGVSSSAALEVAGLRGFAALNGDQYDPVELALAAHRIETEFIGVPCGIMDQYVCSVGRPGMALMLDTWRMTHELVPLFEDYEFIVIHSGHTHKLTDGGYAARVSECQRAAAGLGVKSLSDLGEADFNRIASLLEPECRRARHVVAENQIVLDGVAALKAGDATRFGELMCASHVSQRDDYEVSIAEIDGMVETAMEMGALGARLTGGGFGGSIVVLMDRHRTEDFASRFIGNFSKACILARVAG
jgi:galactokinase